MPYKSDAQRRYFHAAEERGEISHETVKKWDRESKGKDIPEKVSKEHKKRNEDQHYGYKGSSIAKVVDRIIEG